MPLPKNNQAVQRLGQDEPAGLVDGRAPLADVGLCRAACVFGPAIPSATSPAVR